MKVIYQKIKNNFCNIFNIWIEGKVPANSSHVWRLTSQWGVLSLIIFLYIFRVIGYLDSTLTPDALTTYLPYAQRIMDEGLYFLLHKDSILVPPFVHYWSAFFGGTAISIKYANIISGIFMVLLAYGIGRRLHSHAAGLVAAFLFAQSPLIIYWIPRVLTEPPFFLFTLIWMWSLGEVIANKKWAIPVASIALSLSILTRPVWFYPSFLFLLFAIIWFWYKSDNKDIASNIVKVQIFGLCLPIAIIIKNVILFDFPSIALGSGNALYLGTSIMTGGFEPPYLGLSYGAGADSRTIIGNSHLTLYAIEFLKDRTLFELFELLYQKVSWYLLFSDIDISQKASYWRAIELSMAIVGILWGLKQRSFFIIILGSALILQVFQTALVLYNVRYSTDTLGLLIVPLAAVGFVVSSSFVTCSEQIISKYEPLLNNHPFVSYGKVGFLLVMMFIAVIYFNLRPMPKISIPEDIEVSTLFERATPNIINGLLEPSDSKLISKDASISISKQTRANEPNDAIWKVSMKISAKETKGCDNLVISFETKSNKSAVQFKVKSDSNMHTYYIGTAYINSGLFPSEDGVLNLHLKCAPNTEVIISNVSLIVPYFVKNYRDKIFHKVNH